MSLQCGESLSRRNFLGRSLLSGGVLLGGVGGGKAFAAGSGNSGGGAAVPLTFSTPSNAMVSGVDPHEIVLFAFDDHSIPFRRQLDLVLEKPELYKGNPVMSLGREGEPDTFFAALYGTVFRLDGKFRMWYGAVDNSEEFHPPRKNMRLAYAESEDGVHWVKPKLGLREYKGNKNNNLLGLDREAYNSPLVLYEPDEADPEKRYKMCFVGYHHRGLEKSPLLCVAFSRDGLTWKEHPNNPVVRSSWCETSGLYRWNGIYYVNGQTSWPSSNPKRTMISFASPDMVHWEQTGIISFYRHRFDQRTGFHVGPQVHLGASIWHRGNVLLGIYGQWEGPENDQKQDVRMNLGMIISNDGMLFREPIPGFQWIKWGEEKSSWKTIRLLQAHAFVNYGDSTYIWYGGATDPTGKSIMIESRAMVGLATLPRDRFGYLKAKGQDASWVSQTLPAMPQGVELAVNAAGLGPEARIKLEILDHNLVPVSAVKTATIHESGLRKKVSWGDGAALVMQKPWRVRARFEGSQAGQVQFYSLYAKHMNRSV